MIPVIKNLQRYLSQFVARVYKSKKLPTLITGVSDHVLTGSGTWTCPAGIYSVIGKAIGAGAGGQGFSNGSPGQGGGGGAIAIATLTTVPGRGYPYTVAGICAANVNGSSTNLIDTGTPILLAMGGYSNGTGGVTGSCVGTTLYAGGTGASFMSGSNGGGGATSSGAGSNNSVSGNGVNPGDGGAGYSTGTGYSSAAGSLVLTY